MAPMTDTQASSLQDGSAQSNTPHSASTVDPLASATRDSNSRMPWSSSDNHCGSWPSQVSFADPRGKLETSKDRGDELDHEADKEPEDGPPCYTSKPPSIRPPSPSRHSMVYAPQAIEVPSQSSQSHNPASLSGNGSAGYNGRISQQTSRPSKQHCALCHENDCPTASLFTCIMAIECCCDRR